MSDLDQVKRQKYLSLIEERKKCQACQSLFNASTIEGGKFDCDEIGHWSTWKGDLNAKIVVIGQDWGDVDTLVRQKGTVNLANETNHRLVQLLNSIGVSVDSYPLFFTNAVLCHKVGGASARIKDHCFLNCGSRFLKPLLEIIRPPVIIALGKKPYQTLMRIYGLKIGNFKEAVENPKGYPLDDQMRLFPVYHCGQFGVANRGFNMQLSDWEKIGDYIKRL